MPQDGKDEVYDANSEEIETLEKELDDKLEEYRDELGYNIIVRHVALSD